MIPRPSMISLIRHQSTKTALGIPIWPTIPANSPAVSEPYEIRGTMGSINQYFYQARLAPPLQIRKNELFRCFFFPQDHFLGLFRKSTPSLRMKYEDGFTFNDPKMAGVPKDKFGKSLNPMDYSVHRVKARRLIREMFLRVYKDSKGRDGLYVINLTVIPRTKEDIQFMEHEIRGAIISAKKLKTDAFVELCNRKANWKLIESLVESEGFQFGEDLKEIAKRYQLNKTRSSKGKKK